MPLVSAHQTLPDHLQRPLNDGVALRQAGYRGRFAPTPSGPLHLGNLRTALLSWLVARVEGGVWLLRLDDLDTPRIRPGAADSALADLDWLGLHWDGPVFRQSERTGLYHSVLSHWRRQGTLFACRCSRRELAQQPVYPGTCRTRQLSWGWEGQRLPSWRLKLEEGCRWSCGDVVVRRADGFIAYHLATAVDELTLGITEVVRGADLTPVCMAQQAVMAALGEPAPNYRHVPVLCDATGQKLAKRDGSEGLGPWRVAGAQPADVVGHLAAPLGLVPLGSSLTALELLQELRSQPGLLTQALQS